MTLTFTLRTEPPSRIAAGPLVPERLRGLDARSVASDSIRCGRETVEVGDLFEVSGIGDEALVFAGDLQRVDGIGAAMSGGRILVQGACGDHLGARMRGGDITVDGDAGDWAGAEMAGGVVRVLGDAGARLGGAYPGFRAGMSGGEIVVNGDAGEEAGAGMRRGLVVVGGRTGSGAGLRMLAGTVIALGGIGTEAGLGNKRGTLASGARVELLPGYAFAARYRPPALRMQLRQALYLGLVVSKVMINGAWERWSGDRTDLGRGEILIFDGDEEEAARSAR